MVSPRFHSWALLASYAVLNAQALALTVAVLAASLELEVARAPVAMKLREHLWLLAQGQVQAIPHPVSLLCSDTCAPYDASRGCSTQ